MDNMIWRFRAKVVAYVEMVLLCLSLLVVIGLVMVSAGVTAGASGISSDLKNQLKNDEKLAKSLNDAGIQDKDLTTVMSMAAAILWTIVAIWAILTFIQLWAALKLLKSCELGVEPNVALGQARTWRTTSIICTILTILLCLGLPLYILAVIFVWRVGIIVVVYNFIKELERLVTGNAGHIYPTGVVTSK